MTKSSTTKGSSKLEGFISKNWISLATLLISLCALVVSIQSNLISKESNKIALEAENSNLRLAAGVKSDNLIIVGVSGCYSRVTGKYEVVRNMIDTATLTNTGGKGTALVAVKFDDGSSRSYSIKVYDSESHNDTNEIKLPLQFEASETKVIYLSAVSQYDESYSQKELAIKAVKSLMNSNESSNAVAEFLFADGTIIKKEYQENFYSVSPFFETYLDSECNY